MDSEGTRTIWIEPQQQLGAYVAWVNSQLKKKPGVHLIEDLRNDMRDGVIFADIIEIVAKEPIAGIYEVPATYEEMRHNIELVLKFMTTNHIKMHRIHATDIVEGNLKAVMRLILALAAHYKPMSVRHSTNSSSSRSGSRRQSVIDIAQGASAALTEARRNAKKAGKRSSRYVPDGRYQESSSEACSDSDQRPLHPSQQRHSMAPERGQLDGCSADNSPVSSCRASPRSSLHLPDGSASSDGQEGDSLWVDSGSPPWDHDQLDTLKTVKKQLLLLQDLMLEDSMDSGMESGGGESPSTEDWVLVKSRLQQATLLNEELREEVSILRNDCLQLQGIKAGLQQRLGEQDAMLSQLKSDKLHLEIELQTVATENASLRKEVKSRGGHDQGVMVEDRQTRDQTITFLRGELARRERMISRLHQEITQQEMPVSDHVHLRHSTASDHTQVTHPVRSDVSSLWDSMHEIHHLLSTCSHQAPLPFDQVERHVVALLNNVRTTRHAANWLESEGKTGGKDETLTPSVRPVSMPQGKHSRRGVVGEDGEGSKTWVIYFTDDCEQPVTCVIPGRLGEIRLRDFKKLFGECESYRYYFKALDPEYGTVKEELTKEDAVVPGWEDKIVAWVETETGTPC